MISSTWVHYTKHVVLPLKRRYKTIANAAAQQNAHMAFYMCCKYPFETLITNGFQRFLQGNLHDIPLATIMQQFLITLPMFLNLSFQMEYEANSILHFLLHGHVCKTQRCDSASPKPYRFSQRNICVKSAGVTFLDCTPIVDWCVVRLGSKEQTA
jgi:hypothetical protein